MVGTLSILFSFFLLLLQLLFFTPRLSLSLLSNTFWICICSCNFFLNFGERILLPVIDFVFICELFRALELFIPSHIDSTYCPSFVNMCCSGLFSFSTLSLSLSLSRCLLTHSILVLKELPFDCITQWIFLSPLLSNFVSCFNLLFSFLSLPHSLFGSSLFRPKIRLN